MTSFRQIEANRRNAIGSTGPVTAEGKRRSRRNAVRHGLCAETVIDTVEDVEDYKGFEAAVIADYDARTAVERELVLRLASLLWRLRRATAIETDLLRIQAGILRDRRDQTQRSQTMGFRIAAVPLPHVSADSSQNATRTFIAPHDVAQRDLTRCFQRLVNLDNAVFERLGRYESALWRQAVKTLFFLQSVGRR